jgi:hypothetical protein
VDEESVSFNSNCHLVTKIEKELEQFFSISTPLLQNCLNVFNFKFLKKKKILKAPDKCQCFIYQNLTLIIYDNKREKELTFTGH